MKKTKKLALIFGVALVLFGPLISLVPPIQSTTYAAPVDDASVENQMASYIYLRAIAYCLAHANLQTGRVGNTMDPKDAQSYDWFKTQSINGVEAGLGYLDDDKDDGVRSCGDSEDWLSSAYEIWGFDDPIEALCYSGFKREHASNGQSGADCYSGDGDVKAWFRFNGNEKDRVKELVKNINSKFYGKENSTAWPTMTEPMKYVYYSKSFLKLCGNPKVTTATYSDSDIKSDDHLYKLTNADGKGSTIYVADKKKSDSVRTRDNESQKRVELKCGDLVTEANKYAAAYATAVADGAAEGGDPVEEAAEQPETSCGNFPLLGAGGNGLAWFVCKLVAGINDTVNALENVIVGTLCIKEGDIFGSPNTCGSGTGDSKSSTAFHNAWNAFRLIALGLLTIAGLLMILSQGLGFDLFDAYTVKKTLPRLAVAAIGITLSWQLMEFLVTLSNGLGIGIRGLIYAPFWNAGIGTDLRTVLGGGELALDALFGVAAGGIGLALLGPIGLLTFLLTALLAVFIAFLVLVLRNIIVIMLILAAPIAIAAYVLPNTEKYWKTWWDWTIKALMAFPIITAFIAIGHVMAAITITNGSGGLLYSVIAFIAYFAPYFMIPLAFRFAGGLMATLGGFANDRSRGGFDRLKKYRQGKAAYNTQRMKDGERFNNASLNRLSSRATTKRFGLGEVGRAASEQKLALAGGAFAKSAAGEALQHNDGALRALTYENENQARARMAQDWGMNAHDVNESIAAAKASGGFGRNRQVYAAKQLSMTGTGYDNLQQVAETVARVSNGNEGLINDLAGSINSTTKAQGRFDLAPGYGNLVGLSQGAVSGTTNMADYHAATVAASRGADAVTVLRGKPQEVANLTNSLGDHARAQHMRIQSAQTDQERRAATNEFLATMGQIDQLSQSKSYASVDNQAHVNTLLGDTQDLRQHLDGMLGNAPLVAGPNGQPVPDPNFHTSQRTQEQVDNRERYNQVSAPRYNPNDPNNQP